VTQARIVIRDAALERGEQLLKKTRLGSLTELINVMFSRYGKHLEETWEVVPVPNAQYSAMPEPLPELTAPPSAPMPKSDFTFDEPLTGL
jgi:hypothetical protein